MKPNQKPDPRTVYADIINLPHHEPDPVKHPRLPLHRRAAQFNPFAALRGYDKMIAEEKRTPQVDHKRELEEHELEILNQKLNRIISLTQTGEHPVVTFTVYEPDPRKAGGRYLTVKDRVKRVDVVNRRVELMSTTDGPGRINRTVKIPLIMDIKIHILSSEVSPE